MNARLETYAAGLPANQRELLVAGQFKPPEPLDDARLTLHCETLDWLAARVQTPFFLTLDSDVEFLATGWLSEMLDLASRDDLVALGQYEPGRAGYRPRLAPYVLLVRTAAFRALRASFRGHARIADPDEARRWRARPPSLNLDLEELASFRKAMFYTTGAAFFERLEQSGARWSDLPAAIARKFHHLGHMSWAADEQDTLPGTPALRRAHATRLAYVRQRLDQYPGSL
jgi:hypothetical protein